MEPVIVSVFFLKKIAEKKLFKFFDSIEQETSVAVTGLVKKEPRSPGGFELSVTKLSIIEKSSGYPITPKEHGTAFLMDHRHLWLRSKKQLAIMRVRSHLISAARNFFDQQKFVLVDSPILTTNACEGTSTLFKTQYGDKELYLSQTGQLYLEAAAAAHGQVYCFWPYFSCRKI